jgi:hypothetical protein
MRRYILTISTILFLLTPNLVSCSAPPVCLEAKVDAENRVLIRTQKGKPCNKPSGVIALSVMSHTRKRELWYVKTPNSSESVSLDSIVYGKAPTGLVGNPAVELMPGEKILISLRTTGEDAALEWQVPKK